MLLFVGLIDRIRELVIKIYCIHRPRETGRLRFITRMNLAFLQLFFAFLKFKKYELKPTLLFK